MRVLLVMVGVLLLLIAGGCAALAHSFESMYEPKPEFATIAWVLTGIFGLAAAFLIVGSKSLSGAGQPASRDTQ